MLEALIIKGALGAHRRRHRPSSTVSGYARDFDQAVELVRDGSYDGAFFMAPTPIARVHEVAAAGRVDAAEVDVLLPPKVPTGLLFNPLV